jgi:rod shape-determining protein MreD
MKYFIAFVAAWLLAVLHSSALTYVKVLGVTPDLLLIFAASWAIVRGQEEAFVVVPMAGILRDLTTSDPLGTSVLGLGPIVLLAAAARLRSVETEFLPTVGVVAAGSLAYIIISMVVLAATGDGIPWGQGILRVLIPAVIVNSLFTPIVYLPVHWLSPHPTGLQGARRLSSPY